MSGGAQVNKAGQAFSEDYIIVECTDHTDSFYQFHLDNAKMGDFEKAKDMTFSIDMQNDVPIDLIVFQFINGVWTENLYNRFPVANWSRRSFTFKIDARATGWGLRLRFERNENSKGKKFRFKKAKLEKGSVPTDFSKSTYELEQSVNGIKESIKTVEKTQTSFDERVNTVEKNAEGTTASVKKLQETQTAQGKTISEATSKIEQHSKALELQLKMKDVEDYVGGIGNQTVLRNVLWKNDTKYWQLTSNAARDTQVTYKGCNSLSVITTGNASNLYKGASHDYINAGPGWNYVFSAYFYTDNKASIDAGAAIELQCYDVNNKMIKSYLQEITISQGTWIRTHVAGLLIEGTKKLKCCFGFVKMVVYGWHNPCYKLVINLLRLWRILLIL